MTPFPLKVGDLLPRYRAELTNAAGLPLNLTTAVSVAFKMRAQGGVAAKISAAAAFVDRPAGVVEYAFAGADTDTAGDFDTLFLITWPDGPQTIPSSGFGLVRIEASF